MVTIAQILPPWFTTLADLLSTGRVLVYKTNITTEEERELVVTGLCGLETVRKCTIDIEDSDRVLRIEGDVEPGIVVQIVTYHGFEIAELTY